MGHAPRCEVCGWHGFVVAVYESAKGKAPALECTRCRALNLHEDAARNEQERTSVKTAMNVRAAIAAEAEHDPSGRKYPW